MLATACRPLGVAVVAADVSWAMVLSNLHAAVRWTGAVQNAAKTGEPRCMVEDRLTHRDNLPRPENANHEVRKLLRPSPGAGERHTKSMSKRTAHNRQAG